MKTPKETAQQIVEEYRQRLIANQRPDIEEMVAQGIETFWKDRSKPPPSCEVHKRYKGKAQPTNLCETCWRIWLYQ